MSKHPHVRSRMVGLTGGCQCRWWCLKLCCLGRKHWISISKIDFWIVSSMKSIFNETLGQKYLEMQSWEHLFLAHEDCGSVEPLGEILFLHFLSKSTKSEFVCFLKFLCECATLCFKSDMTERIMWCAVKNTNGFHLQPCTLQFGFIGVFSFFCLINLKIYQWIGR